MDFFHKHGARILTAVLVALLLIGLFLSILAMPQ